MKKIDFETVSSFCCKRKGVIFKSIKGQKVGNYNRICKSTKTLCCQDTCPIWNSLDEVIEAAKKEAVVEWLKSIKAKCGSSCDPSCKFGSLCYMRAMYWEDEAIQKAAEV